MRDKQHTESNANLLTLSTLHTKNNNKMEISTTTVTQETFEHIDSIVWFGLNYNPNFIDECWSDDPSLADHLKDKFAMCHGGTDEEKGWIKIRLSYGVFTRFLTMLDNGNREKLYQYILERYSHRKGWL